jgi:guanyl-specific ribonuclease Sa
VPTDATSVSWGRKFKNWGGDLPGAQGDPSPYQEYRVQPTSGSGAGPLRVVRDTTTGETYYTWTHYGDSGNPPFVRIR